MCKSKIRHCVFVTAIHFLESLTTKNAIKLIILKRNEHPTNKIKSDISVSEVLLSPVSVFYKTDVAYTDYLVVLYAPLYLSA